MPKAISTPTTSRRALLHGSGAALAAGGISPALAAPKTSANPDAELLQRCNAYLREELRLLSPEDCGADLAAMRVQYQQTVNDGITNAETLRQVAALPAHTAEGARAKAEIVRLYYRQAYPHSEIALPWPAGPEEQVVWSLVNDLVGRA